MITRLWHGWTHPDNAEAYERLLREEVLPGIRGIDGYRGAYVLRRDDGAEVEFITLTLWDSVDAIRAFAGNDPSVAVVPDRAQALLSHFDDRSVHYDTVLGPQQA